MQNVYVKLLKWCFAYVYDLCSIPPGDHSLWPWVWHGTLRSSTALTAAPLWQTMDLWRRGTRCTVSSAMSSSLLPPVPAANRRFWGWVKVSLSALTRNSYYPPLYSRKWSKHWSNPLKCVIAHLKIYSTYCVLTCIQKKSCNMIVAHIHM